MLFRFPAQEWIASDVTEVKLQDWMFHVQLVMVRYNPGILEAVACENAQTS